MKRSLFFSLAILCGSCGVFWGHREVPASDDNCMLQMVTCQPYETCSAETEKCVIRAPELTGLSPSVVFSDGTDQITITGNYFHPNIKVLIDNSEAKILSVTTTEIKAVVPSHTRAWGLLPAQVTLSNLGLTTSRNDLISYAAAVVDFSSVVINSVIPNLGVNTAINNLYATDINGDKKTDLIARNPTDCYVTIGSGNGSFSPNVASGVASGTSGGIGVMDVNRDGKMDLVFPVSSNFYYALNSGSLSTVSFSNRALLVANKSLPYFSIADLNGDGYSDIFASEYTLTTGDVILSSGASMFQIYNSLMIQPATKDVVIADFNMDGKNDVLLNAPQSMVAGVPMQLRFGNGNGTFGVANNVQSPPFAYRIYAVDTNGDRATDLIVTDSTSGSIFVYVNDKKGNFTVTELKSSQASARLLAVDDYNGDKNIDILSFENDVAYSSAFVFMGKGDGTFRPQIQSYKSTHSVKLNDGVMGDINNDGKPDYIMHQYYADTSVYVFQNALK